MHSLGGSALIDEALVTVCPRIGIRAQVGQELAGRQALLHVGIFVISSNVVACAAVLSHTSELAVRLASDGVALLPEIGLGAVLLDIVESSVGAAEGTGVQSLVAEGSVQNGYVHVRAISVHYLFVSWDQ